MRGKILQYCLIAIMVFVASVSVYEWLDTAASLDHARQQQKTDRERSELLRELIFASKRSAKRLDVAQFIKQNLGTGHLIKNEQDRIIVDDVVFRFDSNQLLSKVQFLDDLTD